MGETYKFKKRPYAHQVKAIKKLIANGFGGALLMSPRTGKTKVVIDYASILYQKDRIARVLVFCPVSVMGVWEDQIAENCPFPYRVLIWDRKGRKRNKRTNRRRQELPRYGDNKLDFVIMNYDALSTPGVATRNKYGDMVRRRRGGRFELMKEIERWQPDLIVLDESHRIKSPSAKKSTALHKLGKIAPYRVIMTGTVVTKKKRIFDIYSQWLFLNPARFAGYNFTDFKSTFGVWYQVGTGYMKWKRNKNEDMLHKLIHQDAFAISREECYDLPPVTHQLVPIPLEESADAYDQMAEDLVARIHTGEITEASIKLVQRLRLQQLSGGVARTLPSEEFPEGRLVRIGREKSRAIESILSDLVESEEKVIIGCQFTADIREVEAVCDKLARTNKDLKRFTLAGGIKRQQRDADIKAFRAYDGPAVFIAQPQAASLGIDLSTASIGIWYSMTSSYVDFSQFEDRIALSHKPVTWMYLIAAPIDQLMYETMQEDGDVARAIMASPESLLRSQD